jgi:hypothetical protein
MGALNMGILSKLNNILDRSKEGTSDETKATFYTTPVAYRDEDGVWVGHNGELWMYRVIDSNPVSWEDPATKIGVEKPLADILYELASTSRDTGGLKALSKAREVHLLALTWETDAQVPKGTPDDLAQFMKRLLYFTVPNRAVVVGVKLWSGLAKDKSLFEQVRDRVTGALGESGPDWESYEQDRRVVAEILGRNGGVIPPRRVREQMESWYNYGRGTDVAAWETEDYVRVGAERIEMAAVMRFDSPILYAPHNQWGLSAQTHPAPVCVASVRGILEPSGVSRNRVRKSQRRVLNEIEEEQASGDIERPEQSMVLQLAQEVEQFILSNREPLVSNCSIVLGRRVQPNVDETYADELRNVYGIETQPLVHRQMAALEETLPTSSRRVNPFVQDLSIGMLAYAGFQGFSNLGDGKGVWVGLTDPDYVPCFLDPLGAPKANRPPGLLIAGDPGSGKTFLASLLAIQSSLAGHQTIFVNPKPSDSLAPMARFAGGRVVKLTEIEEQGGFFDPFRFTAQTPEGRQVAADIASQHILAVLGSRGVAGLGFSQEQEIALIAGLREGATRGAQCVAQAMQFVPDQSVQQLVYQQAADPLFRLGISFQPVEPYSADDGLLLIEFDRPLDVPEKGVSPAEYTRTQRLAVAAVRLVTRSSLEILASRKGGVLVVDEAWMFLQSTEGLAALQSIGRMGRSQNILPIFATQRVDDLLREGVDMEGYLSRVFALQLADEREARAALRLCRLEPTEGRINWLRQAGPRRGEGGRTGRAAMGLHRDLQGRHAAVMFGPVPEDVRLAISTNPEDRRVRDESGETR